MLKDRILATLQFFALQDTPLTLFELHKYLLNEQATIQTHVNEQWEVKDTADLPPFVTPGEILQCLEQQCTQEVGMFRGHYYLKSSGQNLVVQRLDNYFYGIKREQRITRYSKGLPLLPFLRGVGLVGSQAMGKYKGQSDIDLLILIQPGFLWLGRLFITLYFQLFGARRHGRYVANRFCLNHYLARPKALTEDRNIYTASEYLKMRSLYNTAMLQQFREVNESWVTLFFPHGQTIEQLEEQQSGVQRFLEKIFTNGFGRWLETVVGRYQLQRINRSEFVVVEEDELSFHPDNRKAQLFTAFFKSQE